MKTNKNPMFYQYFDSLTKRHYYHNPITNERTWSPPENAELRDPKTKELILTRPVSKPEPEIREIITLGPHEPVKMPGIRKLSATAVERSDSLNSKRSMTRQSRKSTLYMSLNSISLTDSTSNSTVSTVPFYLPYSIVNDQKPFDSRHFAIEKFNTRTRGNFFQKKEIPPDELLIFDTDTSILPILKATPQTIAKLCVQIFNLVLEYCKQSPKAQPADMIEILMKENRLIDETYIILTKLTHNNPNQDHTRRVWELILCVSTFFPSSPDLQPLLRHTLATVSLGTNQSLSSIAKIAYIRFAARCDCGEIFPRQPPSWTNLIPTHPSADFFVFGAPLLELIYAQRRSAPKCTIPLFMHRFAHALFQSGAKEIEGTFRLPGNKVQVDLLVESINNGQEILNGVDLRDLASLFKRWLADMPEPIVPMGMYSDLVKALKEKTIMDFLKVLPRVNHDTLGYLVGFLQEFIQAEEVTRMGILPVSMIFGANVVRIVSNDPKVMKDMTEHGKQFMTFLLTNWDVSFIYPLPLEFIPV